MIRVPKDFNPGAPVMVINIGNTTTSLAMWSKGQVTRAVSMATGEIKAFNDGLAALLKSFPAPGPAASVTASVVPDWLDELRGRLESALDRIPLVLGENVARPIEVDVDEPAGVGMDRLCNAAAAFHTLQRSCVTLSLGTAITVDFVSDDGVFRGGAILPGVRMQLAALHEHAAQLPLVKPEFPARVIGRTTQEAIQNGVCRGIAGAVRWLVEAYATEIHHWPQVVATGGDAVFLAPHCDFIDNVVPDLGLRGIGLAYDGHIAQLAD